MTTPAVSGPARGPGVPAATSSGGPGAAAGKGARPRGLPRVMYSGVVRGPKGEWMARVLVDPERGPSSSCRTVGPFPDAHAAALAHDRVAIAFLGDRARPNFLRAFDPIEQRFLRLCRTRAEIDVCALVADAATYEARYATFLRTVLGLEQWGEYLGCVLDFYIARAGEIGEDALQVGAGEKLAERFVEMHRNKALDPRWRERYIRELFQQSQLRKRQGGPGIAAAAVQPQQQQQQGGGCSAAAVHPQQQRQEEGGAASAAAVQPQKQQFVPRPEKRLRVSGM